MQDQYLFLSENDFVRVMALQPPPSLRAELERAFVVAPKDLPANVVTMYSHVLYLDETAGVCRYIQLVYPEDADAAQGKVSVLAPVGGALLGLEVGQAIDWTFPAGETRRLRVEEVIHRPETDAWKSKNSGSRAIARNVTGEAAEGTGTW